MAILYCLTFPNGKKYIGITSKTLSRRISLHKSQAKREKRSALQKAIRKYGTFDARALAFGTWDYIADLEKKAIAAFETKAPGGYNLTDGGEGIAGFRYSERQRQAMRLRMKSSPYKIGPSTGYRHSEEAKRLIALANTGVKFSDERRRKMSESKMGNKYNVGRVTSNETRLKISLAQKGKARFTDDQKRHMSEVRKGKPWSEARREAMRRAKYANTSS